jgi:hypothetical protein
MFVNRAPGISMQHHDARAGRYQGEKRQYDNENDVAIQRRHKSSLREERERDERRRVFVSHQKRFSFKFFAEIAGTSVKAAEMLGRLLRLLVYGEQQSELP